MNFDHVHPSGHIALHFNALTEKVDEVAARAGVSSVDRMDLETALGALPWRERRRLGLILEGARVSANSEALRIAVGMILHLAANIWARTSPPDVAESKTPPA